MKLTKLLMSAALMGSAVAYSQAIPASAGDLGPTVSKNYPLAVSVSYTAMIGNAAPGTCGCFLLNGGSGALLFHTWRNIGLMAELTGNHTAQIPQAQQSLSLISYMAGPRYTFRTARRLTTYGQFLIGGVRAFDTYIPRVSELSSGGANSFAFAPGGGIEVGVNHWISVRAVEGEYLITHLPNDVTGRQHSARISSGLVFRFSDLRFRR